MKTFIVQSTVALVIALSYQCTRAVAQESTTPVVKKAKVKYTWIVNGERFDAKLPGIVAAIKARQETVTKCSEVRLDKLVK